MSILAHSLDSNRTKDVILDENVNFESLLLNKFVLNGLAKSGFKKPSPVQAKAIPVGRCGFDLIVRSKSGTGKTLVYAVVALELVDISKNDTEVLIIVPTREIVVQIEEVLVTIGSYMEGLQVRSFIGGFPLDVDREKCKVCHIAVGTPGRVRHLITEGILRMDSIRLFVLDEVDKLMESSFVNDINEIYNNLPGRTQVITTTATYTDELKEFLQKYMLSPIYIEIQSNTQFLWGLKQYVVVVKQHSNVVQQMKCKTEEILKIFSNYSFTQCIIFTNYQIRAESISNTLNQRGWTSTYVSAARSQAERLAAVKDLRIFNCKIMLSTDLTARGIDAANIDLVINYDVPVDATTYLHRMGRAGRYGSSGICINLVSEGTELQQIQSIFDRIGGSSLFIPELPKFTDTLPNMVNALSKQYDYETPNENVCNSDSNLKKEINLKNIKQKSTEMELTINSSEKCDIVERDINVILNNTKKSVELIRKQLCYEDTNSFLKSLASGEFKVKSDIHCHNIALCRDLQKLILFNKWKPSDTLHDNGVNSLVLELDHGKTVQEFSTKETLCHTNKALLCVSTILSSKDANNDAEQSNLECIQIYLKMLKDRENKEIQDTLSYVCQNGIEILKNVDQYKCHSDTNSPTSLENVFQKGYDFATKPNSTHWRVYFPDSQIRLQKLPLKYVDNTNEYCMEEEEEEDEATLYKFDTDIRDEESAEDRTENIMKWIPVEQSEKPQKVPVLDSDVTGWEHFSKYFSNCSEYLWQNGLSFENVEDFDNWFCYDWQVYVSAVRNYIQQNIYIQEMNKHGESRRNII